MNKGLKIILGLTLISFFTTVAAQSQETITRSLKMTGNNKYKMCYLDEQVYRDAWLDLGDLRIINAKGQEVPYYLYNTKIVREKEEQQYSGEIIDEFIKDNMSYSDVKIEAKEGTDRLISYLEFEVDSHNFATRVAISASYDGLHWETVAQDTFYDIYKVADSRKMRVYFDEPVKYHYFRIKQPMEQINEPYSWIRAGYEGDYTKYEKYVREKKSTYRIEQDLENKITNITIENEDRLKSEMIQLVTTGYFRRAYELIGYTEENEASVLDTGLLIGSSEALPITLCIPVPEGRNYPKMQLCINNKDDQPIEIEQVKEQYNVDKIVFAAEQGEAYKLVYGGETHEPPSYDLSYYKEEIEAAPQDLVTMGEGERIPREKREERGKNEQLIFKLLIIVASFSMIMVILKSNNRKNKEKSL